MSGTKKDLIYYRLSRAKETLNDARILAENHSWNSTINRLYYSAFYDVSALLLHSEQQSYTHNGVKNKFSELFIKTGIFPSETGRIYSQLLMWRQKGDYDDLFDFNDEKVIPYFQPVEDLIKLVEKKINTL